MRNAINHIFNRTKHKEIRRSDISQLIEPSFVTFKDALLRDIHNLTMQKRKLLLLPT
jgi:hypothetical protein